LLTPLPSTGMNHKTVPCPTCRVPAQVPRGRAQDLMKNFTVVDLLDPSPAG